MKLCGLTGGVGMGKSTAAGFLRQRGIPVLDTDMIARELVQPGQPALLEIQKIFGKEVVTELGELNRAELARLVFSNPIYRQKLEALLHPLIFERWQLRAERLRHEGMSVAFVDIPLLFETRVEDCFEKIVCVGCSPASQSLRLQERRWSLEAIQQRIAAQLSVEEKIRRSHFVVWTEGFPEIHARQIDLILERIG